jgi:hypothetical protein
MNIHIIAITAVILLTSCNSQKDENYDCEDLSMKYYRGLPKPSAQYVKNCKHLEKTLKYSPEVCKKALGILMMTGKKSIITKRFGKKIMGCFNQADLERFLKE